MCCNIDVMLRILDVSFIYAEFDSYKQTMVVVPATYFVLFNDIHFMNKYDDD